MSKVDDANVFAAVGRQLSKDGVMTLQTLVEQTGVSVGSLYHRYGSREGLLALSWLDAVRSFQHRFQSAIECEDGEAGERAAMATPQFCRAEPLRANILVCCRLAEFLSEQTPAALQVDIANASKTAKAAIRAYAKRTGHSLQACRLGLVAFPLGAVRLYLPDQPVPRSIDDYVAAAFRSAIKIH